MARTSKPTGGGDAGELPSSAQIVSLPNQTACQSPLTRIKGNHQRDNADMYVIYIQDPASYSTSVVGRKPPTEDTES